MIGFLLVIVVSLPPAVGSCARSRRRTVGSGRRSAAEADAALAGAGGAAAGLGMAVWLNVLQRLPLSPAYPMLSLNFVMVMLAARWLFHELTTARHWCGVASIMLGILLMSVHS